jgi:hypothetical protein
MISLRNKIVYQGFFVEPAFVDRNKAKIEGVTEKLFQLVKRTL